SPKRRRKSGREEPVLLLRPVLWQSSKKRLMTNEMMSLLSQLTEERFRCAIRKSRWMERRRSYAMRRRIKILLLQSITKWVFLTWS
ncbi:hypothetical protein PENTCL1PPCAC_8671, partial [Pristionchus entomophagus]